MFILFYLFIFSSTTVLVDASNIISILEDTRRRCLLRHNYLVCLVSIDVSYFIP